MRTPFKFLPRKTDYLSKREMKKIRHKILLNNKEKSFFKNFDINISSLINEKNKLCIKIDSGEKSKLGEVYLFSTFYYGPDYEKILSKLDMDYTIWDDLTHFSYDYDIFHDEITNIYFLESRIFMLNNESSIIIPYSDL